MAHTGTIPSGSSTEQLHVTGRMDNPTESTAVGLREVLSSSTLDSSTLPKKQRSFSSLVSQPDPGWRPTPLRRPFLLSYAVITLLSIVALEILLRRSQDQGAVTFETTGYVEILVNFGPMLFAVLYGLLWACGDHSIKRMEPFFQLSKPGQGVSAEHSLLLDYPYMMAITVPFWALKRRHWAVTCSSTMLMLVTFGVTPLSSTIISKETVQRTRDFSIRRASMLPAELQSSELSTVFSYMAYSQQYLNGTLPGFTTTEYAVLPFEPFQNNTTPDNKNRSQSVEEGESWTAQSTRYEGRLDCTPGTVEFITSGPNQNQTRVSSDDNECSFMIGQWDYTNGFYPYTSFFVNGRLLTAFRDSFTPDPRRPTVALGSGSVARSQVFDNGTYCTDPEVIVWQNVTCGYTDGGPYQINCPNKDLLVGFFGRSAGADWAGSRNRPKFDEAAVVFCTPVHEQQNVSVTIDAATETITEIQPLTGSPKKEFTDVDMTYWQDLLIGIGTSASLPGFNVSERIGGGGFYAMNNISMWGMPVHLARLMKNPAVAFPKQNDSKLLHVDIQPDYIPPAAMIGQDPNATLTMGIDVFLQRSQSMTPFGLSLQDDLEDLLDPQKLSQMYNNIYKKLFAMAINTGLSVLDNSSTDVVSGQRKFPTSGYTMDATWVRVLQSAFAVILVLDLTLVFIMLFRKCDLHSDPGSIASAMACVDEGVLRDFEDAEFMTAKELSAKLKNNGNFYALERQKVVISRLKDVGSARAPINNTIDTSRVTLSKPWPLSIATGGISMLVLVLCGIGLSVLYSRNKRQQGFSEPANEISYQIYASYLPTVSATLLESYLVLLGGYVTLLFPFKNLSRGRAPAATTLSTNYDQTSPALQFVNAVKTRNVLLGVMSIAILLANALAVALGGLFFKGTVEIAEPGNVVLSGSLGSLENFNVTVKEFSTDTLGYGADMEPYFAGLGSRAGFRPRPWTTSEFFYLPFSDPSHTEQNINYEAETLGIGAEIKCEPMRREDMSRWHVLWAPRNGTLYMQNKTIEFLTLKEDANVSLILPQYDIPDIHPLRRIQMTWDEAFFNDGRPGFTEWAPFRWKKPQNDSYDFEFIASWSMFEVENRTVTIDRALIGPKENARALRYERSLLGKPLTGPDAFISRNNAVRCKPKPRLVRSKVVADLAGNIIRAEDHDIPVTDNTTGINALMETFYRLTFLASPELSMGWKGTKEPSNWFSLLVDQYARELNPEYDLYSNTTGELTAQSIEVLFKKLFAIFAQLHSDDVFPPADRAATNAISENSVSSKRFQKETRVLMRADAFFFSVGLLVVFLPAILWTYLSLYRAFLSHSPVSLAGTYAAFYASALVLEDVAGTERMSTRERAQALKRLGFRYGYGWFMGRDGKTHAGIEREPLLREGG